MEAWKEERRKEEGRRRKRSVEEKKEDERASGLGKARCFAPQVGEGDRDGFKDGVGRGMVLGLGIGTD